MRKPLPIVAAILLASVVLVGCGSGDGVPDNAEQTLATYFEAYGTDDSSEMERMPTVVGEGTPAALYAEHQINLAVAYESDNSSPEPSDVKVDGQTVTLVDQGLPADATSEAVDDATTTYQDFQYDNAGKLTTWVSEPGGPLAPRIREQTGRAAASGVQIQLKTSYLTNADDLFITLEVRNESSNEVWVTPESYTNPDKRQVNVSAIPYEAELAAGNFATMALSIANGETGGELTFNLYFPDIYTDDTKLTIPVKR